MNPSPDQLRRHVRQHLTDLIGDDAEFAAEMIETYLTNADDLAAHMSDALSAADVELLVRSVHSLKSSSAYVGLVHLESQCREVETALRREGITDANVGRVRSIRQMIAADRPALEQELHALQTGESHSSSF